MNVNKAAAVFTIAWSIAMSGLIGWVMFHEFGWRGWLASLILVIVSSDCVGRLTAPVLRDRTH